MVTPLKKTGQTKQLLKAIGKNDCCNKCPTLSPDANNILQCRSNGLYATSSGGGDIPDFDATINFSVHSNPNTSGTTFSPNTPGLTTVVYVSTIDGSQWTYNGSAYVLYVAPFWSKLGNSGTSAATNFVGTTDNIGLSFRTNNILRASFTAAGSFSTVKEATFDQMIVGRGGYVAGNNNCRVGALNFNNPTTANGNHVFGIWSLYSITTGQENSAFGYFSGQGITTGSFNTLYSNYSGQHITTGQNNICVGWNAGGSLTTGRDNIMIGGSAGGGTNGVVTGRYNTIIGNNITGLAAGLSNNIILSDGQGNIKIQVNENGAISINGSYGTAGQILQTNGSGAAVAWVTPATVSGTPADEEDVSLSGVMNGINPTFTLVHLPIAGSVKLFLRGIRLKRGLDYTISGATITMISIPNSGDAFLADYRY